MKCHHCGQEVNLKDHTCDPIEHYCPSCGKHKNFCVCYKGTKVESSENLKRINVHEIIINEIKALENLIHRLKELDKILPREIPEYASDFLTSLIKGRRE